jgi:alanine-glyoxylate transaminase / serine-glyoxylate transaminase / serine-pyruvate transaminase
LVCVPAERLGIVVDFIPGEWRHPVDAEEAEARLTADKAHAIKAVMVVHTETSTGVTSDVQAVRRALDRAKHPALLLVDTISSLAVSDFRHDEWGVDVTIAGAQKGLMLPPGLGFNAISDKALAASKRAKLPRAYWEWQPLIAAAESGFFPFTPATNMLVGLNEAIAMLEEEGLDNVFARHDRLAEATRRAVAAWGLEILCADPRAQSSTLTAVVLPPGHNADAFRRTVLERFDMSLGAGLGKVAGKVFRIGHLGWFNELTLMGTLAGVEMGLAIAGVPHRAGGVDAAMGYLTDNAGEVGAAQPRLARAGKQ